MEDQERPLNVHDYLTILLRRKWYAIIPFLVAVIIAFGIYRFLPKVYKTTTMILVQSQRVPEAYVRPTITETVTARLSTISQEILSRTRLENVIQEFNLYEDLRKSAPLEEVVERMRKSIEVNVQSRGQTERAQNTFTLAYQGEDPRMVMLVTNKLASLFIEENLKVREMQAEKTSEFIVKELQNMEDQLKKKDQAIRAFKERNMGNLPQQLEANLRTLERMQQQLQTTSEGIKTADEKSMILQNQIEQLKKAEESARVPAATLPSGQQTGSEETRVEATPEHPIVTQYNNLRRDLGYAQSKYTDSHPDVIELKRKIAALDPKVSEILREQDAKREARIRDVRERRERTSAENRPASPEADPATRRRLVQYTEQFNEAQLEARRLRGEANNLKEQIALYQRRIEETPRREEELAFLTRDYGLLKTNYQSLLEKKIQAQMSENLERKQQGEQFRILDPARMPEKPIRPDRNRILLIGAGIGLIGGLGLAWFRETLDQSFHTESEIEKTLGMKVVAVIPNLKGD